MYRVEYEVHDQVGNFAIVRQNISIIDTIPPSIQLFGSANITHQVNSRYVDGGAQAFDSADGIISGCVTHSTTLISSPTPMNRSVCDPLLSMDGAACINPTYPVGSVFQIIYSVHDNAGNLATATKTVTLIDAKPPMVNIIGGPTINVAANEDNFTLPLCVCVDELDGQFPCTNNFSSAILEVPGSHTVMYSCVDSLADAATQALQLQVLETPQTTTTAAIVDMHINMPIPGANVPQPSDTDEFVTLTFDNNTVWWLLVSHFNQQIRATITAMGAGVDEADLTQIAFTDVDVLQAVITLTAGTVPNGAAGVICANLADAPLVVSFAAGNYTTVGCTATTTSIEGAPVESTFAIQFNGLAVSYASGEDFAEMLQGIITEMGLFDFSHNDESYIQCTVQGYCLVVLPVLLSETDVSLLRAATITETLASTFSTVLPSTYASSMTTAFTYSPDNVSASTENISMSTTAMANTTTTTFTSTSSAAPTAQPTAMPTRSLVSDAQGPVVLQQPLPRLYTYTVVLDETPAPTQSPTQIPTNTPTATPTELPTPMPTTTAPTTLRTEAPALASTFTNPNASAGPATTPWPTVVESSGTSGTPLPGNGPQSDEIISSEMVVEQCVNDATVMAAVACRQYDCTLRLHQEMTQATYDCLSNISAHITGWGATNETAFMVQVGFVPDFLLQLRLALFSAGIALTRVSGSGPNPQFYKVVIPTPNDLMQLYDLQAQLLASPYGITTTQPFPIRTSELKGTVTLQDTDAERFSNLAYAQPELSLLPEWSDAPVDVGISGSALALTYFSGPEEFDVQSAISYLFFTSGVYVDTVVCDIVLHHYRRCIVTSPDVITSSLLTRVLEADANITLVTPSAILTQTASDESYPLLLDATLSVNFASNSTIQPDCVLASYCADSLAAKGIGEVVFDNLVFGGVLLPEAFNMPATVGNFLQCLDTHCQTAFYQPQTELNAAAVRFALLASGVYVEDVTCVQTSCVALSTRPVAWTISGNIISGASLELLNAVSVHLSTSVDGTQGSVMFVFSFTGSEDAAMTSLLAQGVVPENLSCGGGVCMGHSEYVPADANLTLVGKFRDVYCT